MKNIYKRMYNNSNILELAKSQRIKIMLNLTDNLNLTNKNILDIGCYDGTLLSLIKNRDNSFYGIEASDYGVSKSLSKGIDIRHFFFDDKIFL